MTTETLKGAAELALNCLDLTSLNDSDNVESITQLCKNSITSFGPPAALCVYSEHLQTCSDFFEKNSDATKPQLATVVNFPKGESSLETVLEEISVALKNKADEIDLVLDYKKLVNSSDLDQSLEEVLVFLKACRKAISDAGSAKLKVIIESGELSKKSLELVAKATSIVIQAEADFVKTSTGKVPVNATLEAAEVMLKTIKESGKNVGFKAAGGIRSVEDAQKYLQLAEKLLGKQYLKSETFRFGASSVLKSIMNVLRDEDQKVDPNAGY